MKRVFCFILIICIISIPFSLTASASGGDILTELVVEAAEAIWNWNFGINDNVKSMTGNEFYNWYSSNGGFDSVYWKALVNACRVEANLQNTTGYTNPLGIKGTWGIQKGLDSSLVDMGEGVYNAAYVSRELVEALNDAAVDYGQEFRGTILDDLGLDYSGAIIDNCLTVWGSSVITFGVGARDNTGGYVVDTSMGLDGNGFGFYCGSSAAPPTFYIDTVRGSSAYLMQDGIRLPNSSIYIVLGRDTLLRVPWFWSGRSCAFHGNGADVSTYDFWYSHYFFNSNTNQYDFGFSGDGPLEIYQHGEMVGEVNNNAGNAWSKYVVADLMNKMRGTVLYFDDSDYDPPETFIPSNVPYDEDDHVVMLVPSDPSSGDTIIYMSPTDYNNYVTEGDIIEGDTVNNFDQSTIENITNNYNSIINEIDTEPIINRLDTIIQKLNKIYNSIRNMNFDFFDPTALVPMLPEIIGIGDDEEELELDWRTLIEMKFPILVQVSTLVHQLENTNSPLVLQTENPLNWIRFLSNDNNHYSDFVIPVAWYSDVEYKGKTGREYVRFGLSIIVYVCTFVGLYRRTDSIVREL